MNYPEYFCVTTDDDYAGYHETRGEQKPLGGMTVIVFDYRACFEVQIVIKFSWKERRTSCS